MAKKKYITLDEFLNQNPDLRVSQEEKSFLDITLNDRSNNQINIGSIPENVPGLPVDSGLPSQSPDTNINPKVRRNKNRGGKRNLRKFKKVEENVVAPRKRKVSIADFRFPYEVGRIPSDISPEELARAKSLLPEQRPITVAESVVNANGGAVNTVDQGVVSHRRGKNRGGRSRRGRIPTPHITEVLHGKSVLNLGQSFTPKKVVSKNGKVRYVNPFNDKEVVFTVNKNGRIKWVNSKFVVDPLDGFVRLANPNESFPSIINHVWHNNPGAESDALYHYYPRPIHGAPVTTPPSIDDAYASGSARPLTPSEAAEHRHRQKQRRKYNSPKRPHYNTREDVSNTYNIDRRKHTVGRYRGSVAEYKAKVASYIRELETELSYLDITSAKDTRRIIINDILIDLRKELRKTADQINPTKTGLPHKLELKLLEYLKGDGKALNFMTQDIAEASKRAASVGNKVDLSRITNMQIPDRIYSSEISHMQKVMIKADVMQDKLPKSVIKRHIKNMDFMNTYMKGGRVDQFILAEDGSLILNAPRKPEVILRRPGATIKVGESVRSARKAESEAMKTQLKAERMESQRIAQEVKRSNYTPSFIKNLQSANQTSATIASAPAPSSSAVQAAQNTVTNTRSRVSNMLGEDTVRAASVIHSSKMGKAAIGVGAMAAVFGFTSALNQRRNFEQEIQNRA